VRAEPYKKVYHGLRDKGAIPTLHVWGTRDDLVPCEFSKELASLFPNSSTFEHQAGHVVPTNAPAKGAYLAFLQAATKE